MSKVMRFIFILLLLTAYLQRGNAQCIAEAGADTVYCALLNDSSSYTMGGNPSVTGGYPPYTYTWHGVYSILNTNFYASDMLNDTTVPNPTFITNPDKPTTFYLTVTDSIGNSCTDSVTVSASIWGMYAEDKRTTITQGDTTSLYTTTGSQYTPLTYEWNPKFNISNDLAADPKVWPDTTTFYTATITDAVGCIQVDPDIFEVFVIPSGITDLIRKPTVRVFPNPSNESVTIIAPPGHSGECSVRILNIDGKVISAFSVADEKLLSFDTGSLPSGIYFIKYHHASGLILSQKFIVVHR